MLGVQQLRELGDWRERKDWESLLPEKRCWGEEEKKEIPFPLKTGASTPPPLLAHYIPAHFPHHFSNDSSALRATLQG